MFTVCHFFKFHYFARLTLDVAEMALALETVAFATTGERLGLENSVCLRISRSALKVIKNYKENRRCWFSTRQNKLFQSELVIRMLCSNSAASCFPSHPCRDSTDVHGKSLSACWCPLRLPSRGAILPGLPQQAGGTVSLLWGAQALTCRCNAPCPCAGWDRIAWVVEIGSWTGDVEGAAGKCQCLPSWLQNSPVSLSLFLWLTSTSTRQDLRS